MLTDFYALMKTTKEERFVTTRQCLQAIWKVGAAVGGDRLRETAKALMETEVDPKYREKSTSLWRDEEKTR